MNIYIYVTVKSDILKTPQSLEKCVMESEKIRHKM